MFIQKISRWFLYVLTQNLFIKFISFSGALMIWAWVQNEKVTEENIRVPVRYIWPEKLVPIQDPRQSVTVTIKGPQGRLKALANAQLETILELSELKAGEHTHEFSPLGISNVPPGLEVMRISPLSILIKMDKPMTKEVIIKPNIVGKPAEGWKISKITTEPKTIAIFGAQALISPLKEVSTEAIKIDNLRKTKKFIADINLPPGNLKIAVPKPIVVQVESKPLYSTRNFADIPVEIRKGEGWVVSPTAVDLVIEGPQSDLDILKQGDLTVLLSIPEGDPNRESISLQFDPKKTNNNIHLVIRSGSHLLHPIKIKPNNFVLQKNK